MNKCRNGHPSTPDNWYAGPNGGKRCRACSKESRLRDKLRKRKDPDYPEVHVRLPLEPLERAALAALGCRGRKPPGWRHNRDDLYASRAQLAELFGVSHRRWSDWTDNGIPLYSADRAAVALGLHPLDLWGPEFHAYTDAA